FFFSLLNNGFGLLGCGIALLAWFVISVIMTFDVHIADLFEFTKQIIQSLREFYPKRIPSSPPPPNIPSSAIPTLPRKINPLPLTSERDQATPQALNPAPVALADISSSAISPQPAWQLPQPETILEVGTVIDENGDADLYRARIIEETLQSFGAPAHIVEIHRGPVITQFGVEPDFIESRSGRTRVRVGKIASLADDLALALSARTVRIQAPVPGKGYVGIEVPNEQPVTVTLRDVIESEAFQRLHSPLRFALGQDVAGNAIAVDLAAMPHLLIAGTTGSGKSVCVNSLISCLLLHNTPNQLRLIMVDPKRVELSNYNGIPHLLAPVVVDLNRIVGVLQWITHEMDQRYHKLAQA
ncbi:MAG: DNA translocase FtsK, partial [Anaerolineales bacterium]